MNPLDFLQTCKNLEKANALREADERTILSRIYYAFFLTLRDGLASKDKGFGINLKQSASDHSLVRDYLKGMRYTPDGKRNPYAGPRVNWYERYNSLFEWRENADYRMDIVHKEISEKVTEFMEDPSRLQPLVENFVR